MRFFLPIAFFAFVQICFGAEWGDAGIKLNTKQVLIEKPRSLT